MIINRKNEYHWQLILVSKLDTELLLKTGTLLLILNHQAPNINPSDNYIMDIRSIQDIDILGTCGLKSNSKLMAALKYNCSAILNGSDQPDYWKELLDSFAFTNVLHFYAYIKMTPLSTTNRVFINAFISNKRSAEYDSAVFSAKIQELFSQFYKNIIFWIGF